MKAYDHPRLVDQAEPRAQLAAQPPQHVGRHVVQPGDHQQQVAVLDLGRARLIAVELAVAQVARERRADVLALNAPRPAARPERLRQLFQLEAGVGCTRRAGAP